MTSTRQVHHLSLVQAADSGPDLAELCRGVAEGQAWALDQVWKQHHGRVRSFLVRMLGPSDEIDDAVQEVFERLFNKLPQLRKPEALPSFSIGIAVRVARKVLYRKRVTRWLGLTRDGFLPETLYATDDPLARDALRRLYAVLDRVGPDSRTLFVLRHVEQLELTEIAVVLGDSLATTKRKLQRAVTRVHGACRSDPALLDYFKARGDA
jgi:RNA polymerase sigma-70 factor (ECF subfamily)